jgi:hypothetical protein
MPRKGLEVLPKEQLPFTALYLWHYLTMTLIKMQEAQRKEKTNLQLAILP